MMGKGMRGELWASTVRVVLEPSSFALATPAASILRLAASVRRWVATKSGMVRSCLSKSPHQSARAGREQLLRRHRLGDDTLRQRMPDERIDDVAALRAAVREP